MAWSEALLTLAKPLRDWETMGRYRSLGRWIAIIVFALMCTTTLSSAGRASELFQEALYHANQGRLDSAIELWTRFLQHHPTSYAAYANRGTAYLWTGHVYKGIADWHKARDLQPLFAYAFYNARFIPEVERNSTMLNYAIPLELEPDHYPSVHMTGSLLLDVGRTDQAAALFRKSLDLTKNPLLKSNLEHWATSLESKSDR
jgi:tetratricopeptide (TPR) repeat protein